MMAYAEEISASDRSSQIRLPANKVELFKLCNFLLAIFLPTQQICFFLFVFRARETEGESETFGETDFVDGAKCSKQKIKKCFASFLSFWFSVQTAIVRMEESEF